MAGWEFWIDRGGTFTDLVARRPDGTLATLKLLSEDPERYDDAALEGMRRLLELAPGESVPTDRIAAIKMGTTVATNALLERRGARTLLVVTRGFGDALRIGRQNREHLFDLDIHRPPPLHDGVVEAAERVAADGEVLVPLDEAVLAAALADARDEGFEAVAIVFIHGWRHSAHEQRAAALAREAGFSQVSASHEVSPLIRFVPRGQTTVADAYLSPVLEGHVWRLREAVGTAPLRFMTSSGRLVAAEDFRGRDAILSGPAGGVVGAVETARAAGCERIIGFDMGGTSTDVSHWRGAYERVFDSEIAGVRMQVPTMAIHTVAAGGGSVCSYDGMRLLVGPESAGAVPGPVGYGRGGPLAVTDCNILLGKLQADLFPAVFGAQGDRPLDLAAVRAAFEAMAQRVGKPAEEVAEGFLTVAIGHMARAIRKITVERGHDATSYTLAVFGGAGGQHGCLVADALGISRILIHPMAGVLSALGMGLADLGDLRERSAGFPLEEEVAVAALLDDLGQKARAALAARGARDIRLVERLHLRYDGTDTALPVDPGAPEGVRAAFEAAHRTLFGFIDRDRTLIVESVAVEAIAPGDRGGLDVAARNGSHRPLGWRPMFSGGRWHDAVVHAREDLAIDRPVRGPAILTESTATTIVEPGWQATRSRRGDLLLEHATARDERIRTDEAQNGG